MGLLRPVDDVRMPRNLSRLTTSINAMHGGVLVLCAVLSVLAGTQSDRGITSHLVVALVEALVAVDVVRRGARTAHLVLLLPVVLLAAATSTIGAGNVTAGFALAAFTLGAVRVLRGLWFAVVVLGTGAAYATTQAVFVGQFVFESVEVFLLSVANTYAAGTFVAGLERGARETDLAQREADAQELRSQARALRNQAVDEARQVLHDDVLTALRAVADPPTVPTPATDPVTLSRTALDRVEEFTGSGDAPVVDDGRDPAPFAVLLSRVAMRSPVETDPEFDVVGAPPVLSAEEDEAVGRALLESLRNVARHTPCERARVRVESRGGVVRFLVIDAGPGIAPGTPDGFGLTSSVHGAMRAVDGSASVTSSPAGTTVALALAPRALPVQRRGPIVRAHEQTVASVGDVRRVVRAVAVPQGLAWAVLGPVNAWSAEHRWTELGLMVALTALLVLAARTIARGAPRAAALLGFGLALALVLGVSLAVMADGGLLTLNSWAVGYAGAVLVVLGFAIPLRWSIGLCTLLTTVLLTAVALRPSLSGGVAPLGSVNALLTTPAISIAMGLLVRRNGRAVLRARRRSLAVAARLSLQDSVAQVSSLHLDHTRRVIVPWLRAIADGRLDPTDPAVQERAGLLALEARDDLHAAGFFDQDLRRRVSRYRSAGGVVEVRSGFEPGSYDRAPGRMLSFLVSRLDEPHRITVRRDPADASRIRVTVVPAPRDLTIPAQERVSVGGDEFAMVLVLQDER